MIADPDMILLRAKLLGTGARTGPAVQAAVLTNKNFYDHTISTFVNLK